MKRFSATMFLAISAGCASANFPGQPTAGDLAREITPPSSIRSQAADDAPLVVAQATPTERQIAPPPALPGSNIPTAPTPGGTQQASLKTNRSARATVRAWVNGRPIFDDEVILELEMRNPAALRESSIDKVTEAYNKTLTGIIEIEIAYQDAVKKLEKGNPRALEKLREMVDQEYTKQTKVIRKNVPEDKFREIAPTFRRQLERQFIGMEYIRSRVFPEINKIGYLEIKDYYDTHLNEFQKVESIKWQHVFLAVNAQRPTLAEARRQGEALLAQVNQGADFASLSKYDDGDSKTRDGAGFGNRKGEIQPAELEKYLFQMAAGQIGPVVEVSTGVHLFRVVEHDAGGQVPLNDTVQLQIKNKIRNQIFEREFKRFVRELKTRAVVEIERGI